ncbi:MAG: ABC transporter ATP-binding protein, partial [Coriobacteriia bacterium]|nr:ABC transporter ATP-binding protein [Coriobacteriia bacterium]
MLKLKGYLKPFILSLLLAFVLLFVQAICDLNLPNLMSDIVNVGIQQGGVEETSPRAISKDGYVFVRIFLDDEGKTLFDDSYTLVAGKDADPSGKTYASLYPASENASIYVLKPGISNGERQKLDEAFGIAAWTMVNLFKQVADNPDFVSPFGSAGNQTPAATGTTGTTGGIGATGATGGTEGADQTDQNTGLTDIDLTEIYKLIPMLEMLAQYQPKLLDDAREAARNIDELMRDQTSTVFTGAFYKDLGMDMERIEMNYIVRIGLIMLLVTVISGAATVLVGFLSSRIGAGVSRNLRHDIFAKVSDFSHTEFDRFSTASLITRSTNDVTQMQMVLTMGIRMICYAPIMAIGAAIMAMQKSLSMSWTIGIAILFLLCLIIVLLIIVMPKFKIIQILIDRLNLVAPETLNGLMVIRAFGRGNFERQRFEAANWNVTKTNLFIQRAMVVMMPILMIFMNGLMVLIIWVGAHQVAQSTMQVGDMMAYMQYAMQVVMSFMFIAMMFIFIPRASVSAGRIAEVLETEPVIKDPETPQSMDQDQRGRVEFRSVDFRFNAAENDALSSISFIAEPGTTTAFIGSTGSGKSTILNLITRFYDVSAGAVLVGGVDVREMTQHELRSRLGYVPQKSVLMAGTIAENIAYGKPELTYEDIENIAAIAQAS